MIKVVLSGNIACGKSEVEKILMSEGFKVIDSDVINNTLLTSDLNIRNKIISIFGSQILYENKISKQKLGEIVFSNHEKKLQLENILHPKIFEKIEDFFEAHKNESFVFVSVPLLFETHWEKFFDKIIFISADKEIRLKRLMERNNFSKETAIMRINAQETEEEKIKKADFVIYNNSDLNILKKSVLNIIKQLY